MHVLSPIILFIQCQQNNLVFSIQCIDIVILSKKNIVMSAVFEFAIQKCPNVSNLPYGIAPVCFK